jgi:uncharacterized BrkB/YihY/UPF0761 family membrane protein
MASSNPVFETLEAYGVFTFLAYLLLFIVLYYFFKYVLEKKVKRLESSGKRQLVAVILSILVTVLLYFLLAPFASTGASYIATIVFVLLFVFLVVAVAAKILGVDLVDLIHEARSK